MNEKPWTIISGGPAKDGGVYKTTDGGEQWTHLTTGMPSNLIGKVWVEIAQSRPSVVYAMVEAPGNEGGVFRSDNSGQSWTLVNSRENLRARPFYFNYLHVNPKNENEIWVSEVNLNKSSDGGKTFTNVVTPHSDHHAIWFNPDNPNIMILGSDGGGSISQDAARSWSSVLNQPTAEVYDVDTDQQFPYRVYGPQQDNSTVVIASRPQRFRGRRTTRSKRGSRLQAVKADRSVRRRMAKSFTATAKASSVDTTSRLDRNNTTGFIHSNDTD